MRHSQGKISHKGGILSGVRGAHSVAQLEQGRAQLDAYMTARDALVRRAQQEAQAQHDGVLEVAKANKPTVRAADKRAKLYRRGKLVKPRTRRLAQKLKTTRTAKTRATHKRKR